ncbi:MAG: M20 family metallopeptidase [Rhodocyclaceae bacterium]|nr:M20 family metallopeptidase [Rhodocyclaceae bacterium]
MEFAAILPDIVARTRQLRRDLHAHPELAFEERRTSAIVAERLRALGIETHTGMAKTGVVGVVRAGTSSRAIGLRADMDALPLMELNDFPHRSQVPGRMHACGHDGHTAMLVGAAEALVHLARQNAFDGTVYLIFQPAEEHEGGGKKMVEEGLFARFPMQYVFGLHNWPGLSAGSIAVIEGPVMAGADRFEIVLRGRGAHAAMPHQGTDTILAGAALIQALHNIRSREIDPLDAAVISVTRFSAGHADNVLPEMAVLGGTVRTFRPEHQDAFEAAMGRILAGLAEAYRVSIEWSYQRGYPPTVNDRGAAALARNAVRQALGDDRLVTGVKPSMGAEDFAYLAREVPGCYVWLGNGPGAGGCLLHSPHYDFNDEIIESGIRYWLALVMETLAKHET